MPRRPLTTALATIAAALALAPAADAGTYDIEYCTQAVGWAAPGAAPGWSTSTAGTSLTAGASISAWPQLCTKQSAADPAFYYFGVGAGWDGRASIGSHALTNFAPPAGASIARVRGKQQIFVGGGGFAAAGIFTTSGRALNDVSGHLAGIGEFSTTDVDYSAAQLGSDGGAGISIGAKCPPPSDPIVTYCRVGVAALDQFTITISDPTPPAAALTGAVDAAGVAMLQWSAEDPQSGISGTSLLTPDIQGPACDPTRAPTCPPAQSGTVSAPLAPGETRTFTLTAYNATGDATTRTLTLTRPGTTQPPPTTGPGPGAPNPPSTGGPSGPGTTPPNTNPGTTPPKATKRVTLTAKRSGRRLTLKGTAKGCSRVTVTAAGRKTTAKVSRTARWTARLTTRTSRKATITAKCSTAKRTVKR